MVTTISDYTLPAVCHVVCTLVATGIPGINITDSVPVVNQSSAQHDHPATLPDGYVAHPDVGFAYKVHTQNVTWIEARSRCEHEGAQLALIDSAKKLEYVKRQKRSSDYAKVGIIRMYDAKSWIAVSTGLPVTSLPWYGDFPSDDSNRQCVSIYFPNNGLGNYPCTTLANYICELPILQKTTIPDN